MPYRSRKQRRKVEQADEGLVADMVRQFADRWAFVRELVQNGIDAGATRIEVGARRDASGTGRFWVRDDGSGMDRAIIEGPLLTLFSSAKDQDETKIGKYGVGFVSVFAIEPTEVVVETWQANEAWRLRLFPDHRYELSELSRAALASPTGTVVTVMKELDGADAYGEHADRIRLAAKKWCRHAHLPIEWREGDAEPKRIDEPVDVASPVKVRVDAEGLSAVVGVAPDPSGEGPVGEYGFYQRGLTLIETTQPPRRELRGLRCKVDSAALKHTISRDNVRHDRAYEHAVRQLVTLAGDPLRTALIERIAEEVEGGAPGDDYPLMVAAAVQLDVSPSQILVPLAAAVEGSRRCPAAALSGVERQGIRLTMRPVLFADASSPLTEALGARGHRVLLAPKGEALAASVAAGLGCGYAAVTDAYAHLEAASPRRGKLLVEVLAERLSAAGAAPPSIALVRAADKTLDRAAVAVGEEGPPFLVHRHASPSWLGRLSAEPVALWVGHPAVKAALKRIRPDDTSAAELLARYLLVEERGEVSRGQAQGLWDIATEQTR